MNIDRFINVSFALALLFVIPAVIGMFIHPVVFAVFGSLAAIFGMLELGAIAIAFLLDKP